MIYGQTLTSTSSCTHSGSARFTQCLAINRWREQISSRRAEEGGRDFCICNMGKGGKRRCVPPYCELCAQAEEGWEEREEMQAVIQFGRKAEVKWGMCVRYVWRHDVIDNHDYRSVFATLSHTYTHTHIHTHTHTRRLWLDLKTRFLAVNRTHLLPCLMWKHDSGKKIAAWQIIGKC